MEAIPLLLASTAKAVLFGAVMPSEMGVSGVHSDALAPTALDSHPVALSAPSNTPEAAAPEATPPVATPQVTPAPADVGHEIPKPGDMVVSGPAPESAAIGGPEHSTVTEVSGSATDTSSAAQATQATPTAAESGDLPKVAVDTDVADVAAKAAKSQDVAFNALQTSHDKVAASKPIIDEKTLYINQKIHDFFSGGISPSDVSSVVKESVTVLREFDKLNQWDAGDAVRSGNVWEDAGRCGDVKDQRSLKSLASHYEKDPAALLGRHLSCKIHQEYRDSKSCLVVLILVVVMQEKRYSSAAAQHAVCFMNLSRAPMSQILIHPLFSHFICFYDFFMSAFDLSTSEM